MEPKRKSIAPPKKGGGGGGRPNHARKHSRQKSKSKNNNNKGGNKPPLSPPVAIGDVANGISSDNLNSLEKTINYIKKQQIEESQQNKKEKQKQNEERKKLMNETLKKKQEEEKQLKLQEEEKNKQLEKQREEAKKELDEINYQLMLKGAPIPSTSGTIRGISPMAVGAGSVRGAKSPPAMDLGEYKRKTIGRGITSFFGLNQSTGGTIGNQHAVNHNGTMNGGGGGGLSHGGMNDLKKYSSNNSLGLKSANSMFRTISVPRVSKGQVSLQELFQNKQNSSNNLAAAGTLTSSAAEKLRDLAKQPANPSRPLSSSGFKPSWYGTFNVAQKLKEDNTKRQSVENRWDEYVKTLLPTDLENIKQKKLQRQLKDEVKQQKILNGEEASSSSEEEEEEEDEEDEQSKPLDPQLIEEMRKDLNVERDYEYSEDEEEDDEDVLKTDVKDKAPSEVKTIDLVIEDVQDIDDIDSDEDEETVEQVKQPQPIIEKEKEKTIMKKRLSTTSTTQSTLPTATIRIGSQVMEIGKEDEPEPTSDDDEEGKEDEEGEKGQEKVTQQPPVEGGEQPTTEGGEAVVVEPVPEEPYVEPKEVTDGNMIISALLNKTTRPAKEYKPKEGEMSLASQRPPDMVNIFKYGLIDIDFAEIFGEVEDLKGFIMWSVGAFGVEERDYEDYAVFYSKDCYIVFNLSDSKLDSKMYNVHIWIGKEAPIDRIGTAAMMTLQLATHMGGKVNHYREEQGNESKLFLSYFYTEDYNGVKQKSGGAASDFNIVPKIKPTGPTSLYKVDIPLIGEKSGRLAIRRVALSKKFVKNSPLEVCYVLENNERIYIKLGAKATVQTKSLARQLAKDYSNSYANHVKVIEVVGDALEKEFYKYMSEHKTKEDRDKDYKTTEEEETIVNLYRTYTKDNGKLDLESIVEEYPIEYYELNSKEVFILDCTTEVFVWAPRTVNKKKVMAGRECGKMFFNEYERPQWAKLVYITEGEEPPLFKYQFKNWPAPKPINFSCLAEPKTSNIVTSSPPIYNFEKIINNLQDEIIEPVLKNNPNDTVDVYTITLPELQFFKVDGFYKGHFYEDDCYMIIVSTRNKNTYKTIQSNEPQTTIYWWEGVHADPKGFPSFVHGLYPIIAQKFVEMGQLKPRCCLVKQRKEPDHFLGLFGNKLVIHKGSRFDIDISDKIYQFISFGQYTYIQQIDQNTTLLNSFYCYFLVSLVREKITIWRGKFNRVTTDEELELFASYLDKEYYVKYVNQSREGELFWKSLPGMIREPVDYSHRGHVLYRFYFKNTEFCVDRIKRMFTSDLSPEYCCLLETRSKLYFWIGSQASATLVYISNIFVNDYCKYLTRSVDCIKRVYQGLESLKFKHQFPAWDNKDSIVDPLELRRQRLTVQRTLEYRKQCDEEQQLLREYLEYASSLEDDDYLEDFEIWVMEKKGIMNGEDGAHHHHHHLIHRHNSNPNNNHHTNNNTHNLNSTSTTPTIVNDPTTPPSESKKKTKKSKFLGIFKNK